MVTIDILYSYFCFKYGMYDIAIFDTIDHKSDLVKSSERCSPFCCLINMNDGQEY